MSTVPTVKRTLVILGAGLAVAMAASCTTPERWPDAPSGSGSGGAGGEASGGAGGQGGSGCEEACPTPVSPCFVAACKDGACAFEPIPAGSAPDPTPGDCQALYCDDQGNETLVIDANDAPDDMNECTTDACDGVTPTHTPTPGSACALGVCDDAGACVPVGMECQSAADCGAGTECAAVECVFGFCKVTPKPAGAFCNGLEDQCDGSGACVDCVNSGGCGECCACANNVCVQV